MSDASSSDVAVEFIKFESKSEFSGSESESTDFQFKSK